VINLRSGKEVKSPGEEEEIVVTKKDPKDKGKQIMDESALGSKEKENVKERDARVYVP